jgi:RHS repeat-associated protein
MTAVLRDENRNGDGDCTDADDQRLYYANDANMNVTALLDTSGNVVERYGYDPYGEPTILDADWTADGDGESDYANAYLFQGRRLDGETDLYYFRNRMYSAAIGRFVQRDPLEYADVINLYEFARTNPPCHRDATGQVSTRAWRHIRRIRLSINQFGRHVGETQEACLKRAAKLIAQWRKNSKELLETSLQDIRHRARLLQAYEREREILEKMTEVTGISTALHVTHRVLHRRHLKLLSAGHVKAAKGAGKAAKGIMAIHVALLGVDAVNAWRLGLDFGGIELTGVQRETARTTLENFKLRVRFAQDFGKKAPGICCRRTDVASAGQ